MSRCSENVLEITLTIWKRLLISWVILKNALTEDGRPQTKLFGYLHNAGREFGGNESGYKCCRSRTETACCAREIIPRHHCLCASRI